MEATGQNDADNTVASVFRSRDTWFGWKPGIPEASSFWHYAFTWEDGCIFLQSFGDDGFACSNIIFYEGLRSVMRFTRNPIFAAELKRRFYVVPHATVDGPVARLRAVAQTTILGPLIYQLIDGNFSEDKWLHDLRETWRNFLRGRVSIGSEVNTILVLRILIRRVLCSGTISSKLLRTTQPPSP